MLHTFLTFALDGGEWSASRLGHITGLDAVAKKKIPIPSRESNSDSPARSLLTILTEISRRNSGYKCINLDSCDFMRNTWK
jgi:hypothetical protein